MTTVLFDESQNRIWGSILLSGNIMVKSSFLIALRLIEYFYITIFNPHIISAFAVQALLTHFVICLDSRVSDGFIVLALLADNVVSTGLLLGC